VTAVPKAMAGEIISKGTFYGQSKHVTTGQVTIEKEGDKVFVVLGSDFSLDGAPAPTLGFGNGEKFDTKTEFTKLKKLNGRQVYELPKSIALSAYDTFTVWCSKFGVPLGSAKLS
ncbi:MAG: DM13 domain-containing protein, partial [Pseudomonadota bacterium]